MTRARDVADAALAHITTQTFSGVASVSVNDCFSSDYDNYKILLHNFSAAASGNDLRFRGRIGTTDQTAANYSFGSLNISSTSTGYGSGGASVTTGGVIGFTDTSVGNGCSVEIYAPNLPIETGWTWQQKRAANANGYFGFGSYQNTAQLTGFTIAASGGGNISGTISVYGYRK